MPSPGPTIGSLLSPLISRYHHVYILVAAFLVLAIIGTVFAIGLWQSRIFSDVNDFVAGFCRFFYSSFLKPYSGDDSGGQQDALECFYRVQVRPQASPIPAETNIWLLIRLMSTMRRARGFFVAAKTC